MSKRTERREAARKLAYQQRHNQAPAAAQIAPSDAQSEAKSETIESDLLARAQAFFERPPAVNTTSEAQFQANRANAQLSTGPTTTAGKAVASRDVPRFSLPA